jgi:hypothetical protein
MTKCRGCWASKLDRVTKYIPAKRKVLPDIARASAELLTCTRTADTSIACSTSASSPHFRFLLPWAALLASEADTASSCSPQSKQKAVRMSCGSAEIFLKEFSKPPCRRKQRGSLTSVAFEWTL